MTRTSRTSRSKSMTRSRVLDRSLVSMELEIIGYFLPYNQYSMNNLHPLQHPKFISFFPAYSAIYF